MRFYLAAAFSRRAELAAYAAELRALGHTVTSRWHEGECHQASEEELLGPDQTVATRLASEDWDDLERAELLIAFTDGQQHRHGARHAEFGLALGLHMVCWVCGPSEHIFHSLADSHVANWRECLALMAAKVSSRGQKQPGLIIEEAESPVAMGTEQAPEKP